ncbi:hypothetical protein AQUCO_08600042v1 [Aquilegia coerulea]|uniref:F-box domain-containing protein n=1 Tax=Aquilegia coerulea TaxID=218851 RepID=A0A2G5C6H4_AQUCA|nr:hypothetical protein AQUCO_08600042v1 [Aquilegia coerulea]
MANLPQDIIPNILSRLPVKSLLRFRCISKHWCSLIDDSDFVKMHLNHAIQNEKFQLIAYNWLEHGLYSVDCDTSYTEAVKLDYPSYEALGKFCLVMGSCKGLLYLKTGSFQTGYYDVIWNSCTKEFKRLPREPIESDRPNPWQRNIIHGFGYNPIINDYKVVKIRQYYRDDYEFICFEVMVYTLGTDSWRIVDGALLLYFRFGSQLSGNGNPNPHWLVTVNADSCVPRAVVYFDLVSEKFCEIELPKSVGNIISAGTLGGCLCLFGSLEETRTDVWVMKEYGVKDSWVKFYTIIYSTVIGSVQQLKILCHSNNGKILFRNGRDDLILYDPKVEDARILEIHGLPANCEDMVIHVGSLVSLKTGTYGRMQTKNKRERKQNK